MFETNQREYPRPGERFGQRALKMSYDVTLWKSFVVVKINKNQNAF